VPRENFFQLKPKEAIFIENFHDESIMDDIFGTSDEQIKVSYTVNMD
jgi:hypothetical protein